MWLGSLAQSAGLSRVHMGRRSGRAVVVVCGLAVGLARGRAVIVVCGSSVGLARGFAVGLVRGGSVGVLVLCGRRLGLVVQRAVDDTAQGR